MKPPDLEYIHKLVDDYLYETDVDEYEPNELVQHFRNLRDCFYHFTQYGTDRRRRKLAEDQFGDMDARSRLINILNSGELHGHSKGYYMGMPKTVSFSRATIENLPALIKRNAEYGFFFNLGFLILIGFKPVQHLSKRALQLKPLSIRNKPFADLISDTYNFEWEREYRLVTDIYKINLEDLRLKGGLIVPKKEKKVFLDKYSVPVISAEEVMNWKNHINKIPMPLDPEEELIIAADEIENNTAGGILTDTGELSDDGIADELIVTLGEEQVEKQINEQLKNLEEEPEWE